MEKIMNAGIQIIPVNVVDPQYSLVDRAIETIQHSGLSYTVTPFETVVNGSLQQILQLIAQLKTDTEEAGADELIINTRFHSKRTADTIFETKISKF